MRRRFKRKHPSDYLRHAGSAERIGGDSVIEPAQRPFEFMLNALRLVEGFSLTLFEQRTGLARHAIAEELTEAQARGWTAIDGEQIPQTGRAPGRATASQSGYDTGCAGKAKN